MSSASDLFSQRLGSAVESKCSKCSSSWLVFEQIRLRNNRHPTCLTALESLQLRPEEIYNIHMRKLSVASYFASAIVLALCQFPTVCLVFVIVIDVLLFFLFLQESDKGQIFYWSIQTCSRIMQLSDWLIDCHHAQKTSKLPYFRLFRPDTQILSALTALY